MVTSTNNIRSVFALVTLITLTINPNNVESADLDYLFSACSVSKNATIEGKSAIKNDDDIYALGYCTGVFRTFGYLNFLYKEEKSKEKFFSTVHDICIPQSETTEQIVEKFLQYRTQVPKKSYIGSFDLNGVVLIMAEAYPCN